MLMIHVSVLLLEIRNSNILFLIGMARAKERILRDDGMRFTLLFRRANTSTIRYYMISS